MMRMQGFSLAAGFCLALSLTAPAGAGEERFSTGPVFTDYGPVADIDSDFAIPDGAVFKTSFDVREAAKPGELNRTLVAAARFINMHARVGAPMENLNLAIIVHGGAVHDVADDAHYAEAVGGDNANAPLVAALTAKGVRIIVCGQSAAYYDLEKAELLPEVQMALSAMTAHALLQADGYALNPF